MLVRRFHITNYKSIIDSGWVAVDKVTAFVGKIESGKTTVLEALNPHSSLCFGHAKRQLDRRDLADLSADLFAGQPAEFKTPEQINDLLAKVVLLLAQGRISPRRAAVITFACSLLLRSVVVIDRKIAGEVPQIIFDLPRPDRSHIEQGDFPSSTEGGYRPSPYDRPHT